MSDSPFRDRVYPADRYPNDLSLPFIFVPHGAPMPTEWMAEHPAWVKIPACLVPKGAPMPTDWMADHPGWLKLPATFNPLSAAGTPVAEDAGRRHRPPTWPTPVASLSAASGLAAADALALDQLIALGASALTLPLAAAGLLAWPRPAGQPHERARLKQVLRENDGKGLHGGLVPPPPTPPAPGLGTADREPHQTRRGRLHPRKARGIAAPLHNSRHPKWNEDNERRADEKLRDLSRLYRDRDGSEFDRAARNTLEKMIEDLRQRLLILQRLLENDNHALSIDA